LFAGIVFDMTEFDMTRPRTLSQRENPTNPFTTQEKVLENENCGKSDILSYFETENIIVNYSWNRMGREIRVCERLIESIRSPKRGHDL
jgi:hypothetical protein